MIRPPKSAKLSLLSMPLCALVMGCTVEADDFTESSFATVTTSGSTVVISGDSLTNSLSGSEMNGSGDGFAYEAGVNGSSGFVARSGVISGTTVAALPSSGTATMSGNYAAARVTSISLSGNQLTGLASETGGSLTLVADFAQNTLEGTSDDSNLLVLGTFSGKALDGSVIYRGIRGSLTGLVGGDQAVGAFHGKTDDELMAGGFMVDE